MEIEAEVVAAATITITTITEAAVVTEIGAKEAEIADSKAVDIKEAVIILILSGNIKIITLTINKTNGVETKIIKTKIKIEVAVVEIGKIATITQAEAKAIGKIKIKVAIIIITTIIIIIIKIINIKVKEVIITKIKTKVINPNQLKIHQDGNLEVLAKLIKRDMPLTNVTRKSAIIHL